MEKTINFLNNQRYILGSKEKKNIFQKYVLELNLYKIYKINSYLNYLSNILLNAFILSLLIYTIYFLYEQYNEWYFFIIPWISIILIIIPAFYFVFFNLKEAIKSFWKINFITFKKYILVEKNDGFFNITSNIPLVITIMYFLFKYLYIFLEWLDVFSNSFLFWLLSWLFVWLFILLGWFLLFVKIINLFLLIISIPILLIIFLNSFFISYKNFSMIKLTSSIKLFRKFNEINKYYAKNNYYEITKK